MSKKPRPLIVDALAKNVQIMSQRSFEEEYWEFFEKKIGRYSQESLKSYYSEVLDEFQNRTATEKHVLVLEIGCGYGYLAQTIAEEGYECLGLDVSRKALSKIGSKLFDPIRGDAQSGLPLIANSIDVIVMLDVIEHLDRPDLALKEVARVLKSNGLLYVATPNLLALERFLKRKMWHGYLDKTHRYLFTPFSLRGLLKEYNFKVLKCYTPMNSLLGRRIATKFLGFLFLGGQIRLLAQKRRFVNNYGMVLA